MRFIVAGLLLAFTVLLPAAQRAEPPEYPPGLSCSPAGVRNADGTIIDADHPCHCKRMQFPQEENGCCDGPATHDPVCSQWCHEDHCACPMSCAAHPQAPQAESPSDQEHH